MLLWTGLFFWYKLNGKCVVKLERVESTGGEAAVRWESKEGEGDGGGGWGGGNRTRLLPTTYPFKHTVLMK